MREPNLIWADLHLHSPYSIATSPAITPRLLAQSAAEKGVGLLLAPDALHPKWLEHLNEELVADSGSLFKLAAADSSRRSAVSFVLGGEVSCVWKSKTGTKRVHLLHLLPDFDTAKKLAAALERFGKLGSDGRPTLKMSCTQFMDVALGVDKSIIFIAPHIWTPWYGILGGRSGFDTISEALGSYSEYLTAVESGLSSDPAMIRMVPSLDRYPIVSFSDAHGPGALAREATLIERPENFASLAQTLATPGGVKMTIEFPPQKGKYFNDGHRKCGVNLAMGAAAPHSLCPVCAKPLTQGVMSRIASLGERTHAQAAKLSPPHMHLIPLADLAATCLGRGRNTKIVKNLVKRAINAAGTEIAALTAQPTDEVGDERLAAAIYKMQRGEVIFTPGFDGEFGKMELSQDA